MTIMMMTTVIVMMTMMMSKRSDMRRLVAVFSAVTAVSIGMARPALADDYRGTVEQQLACTPDVFRLCGSEIPDADRIVVCLRQNTTQFSGPCRSVFDANASMPPESSQTEAPRRPPSPNKW